MTESIRNIRQEDKSSSYVASEGTKRGSGQDNSGCTEKRLLQDTL